MGNKIISNIASGQSDHPVSLYTPEKGVCFGENGTWRPIAQLSVLDTFYQIPCLCECITGSIIDANATETERQAVVALQQLFNSRVRAVSGTIVSCDRFFNAFKIALKADGFQYDDEDPSQVYHAIVSLILRTLPDIKGIFLDQMLQEKQSLLTNKSYRISIALGPCGYNNLETAIKKCYDLTKIKSLVVPAPVFVITTSKIQLTKDSLAEVKKSTSPVYSFQYPVYLNLEELIDGDIHTINNMKYHLQAVLVQPVDDSTKVESFFRSGTNLSWYADVDSILVKTTIEDVIALGSDPNYLVRMLVYIQSDLPSRLIRDSNISSGSNNNSNNINMNINNNSNNNSSRGSNASNVSNIKSFYNNLSRLNSNDDDGVPMDEDTDCDGDDTGDGDEDYDGYGDDDDDDDYYDDDEDDDFVDYEEERSSMCQCPSCRRERESQVQEHQRLRLEKEAQERVKLDKIKKQMTPKTPGTRSVAFQPTITQNVYRVVKDKSLFRESFLQSISCMEGYSNKSVDELRFEDYCIDYPACQAIKKRSDAEMRDRLREAKMRKAMEDDEISMRKWAVAADKAILKHTAALAAFEQCNYDQACELFTQALKICYIGPHSVDCYYNRALCISHIRPTDIESICFNCQQALSINSSHHGAHYLLGSCYIKLKHDWEVIEMHLTKAHQLQPSIFDEPAKEAELVLAKNQAAKQRLINQAETKKVAGNNALTRCAFTEAERLYGEAIDLCPNSEFSHIYYCNRAAARFELGLKAESNTQRACQILNNAIDDCDRSLELQPDYTKANFRRYFCKGVLSYVLGNLDESLVHLNAALELDPTNATVKQEVKKVTIAIDVIKAKDKAIEIEREMAIREEQRQMEKEREKKLLEEKKMRDEQIRREKAEKADQEKAERLKLKAERELAKADREKSLAEEKEREKERLKAEKERERIAKEQEKVEERERKRLDKEKERERLKAEKEQQERDRQIAMEKEMERKKEFALEMGRVQAVLMQSNAKVQVDTVTANAAVKQTVSVDVPIDSDPMTSNASASVARDDSTAIVTAVVENKVVAESATATTASASATATSKKPVASTLSILSAITKSTSKSALKPTSSSTASTASTTMSASAAAAAAASNTILTKYMKCPLARVGSVIGAKGTVIGEIMKRTGAKVSVNQDYPEGHPRKVVLVGTSEQIDQARVLVEVVIVHGPLSIQNNDLIKEFTAKLAAESKSKPDTPAIAVVSAPSPAVSGVATIVLPSNNQSSAAVTDPYTCTCCKEIMIGSKMNLITFGLCNHKSICSMCALKRRCIKNDYDCYTCQQKLDHMICTNHDTSFVEALLPGSALSGDLFLHKESKIYFSREYTNNVINHLYKYKCKECGSEFPDVTSLQSHYSFNHNTKICTSCHKTKVIFPYEHEVYTQADYDKHQKEEHPHCAFCLSLQFSDSAELMIHVIKEHHYCFLCQDVTPAKYYKDDKKLNEHYNKDHFVCEEDECIKKKNIVFKSLFDLQTHMRLYHSLAGAHVPSFTPTIPANSNHIIHGTLSGSSSGNSIALQSPIASPMLNSSSSSFLSMNIGSTNDISLPLPPTAIDPIDSRFGFTNSLSGLNPYTIDFTSKTSSSSNSINNISIGSSSSTGAEQSLFSNFFSSSSTIPHSIDKVDVHSTSITSNSSLDSIFSLPMASSVGVFSTSSQGAGPPAVDESFLDFSSLMRDFSRGSGGSQAQANAVDSIPVSMFSNSSSTAAGSSASNALNDMLPDNIGGIGGINSSTFIPLNKPSLSTMQQQPKSSSNSNSFMDMNYFNSSSSSSSINSVNPSSNLVNDPFASAFPTFSSFGLSNGNSLNSLRSSGGSAVDELDFSSNSRNLLQDYMFTSGNSHSSQQSSLLNMSKSEGLGGGSFLLDGSSNSSAIPFAASSRVTSSSLLSNNGSGSGVAVGGFLTASSQQQQQQAMQSKQTASPFTSLMTLEAPLAPSPPLKASVVLAPSNTKPPLVVTSAMLAALNADNPLSPEDEEAILEFSPATRERLVEVLRRHPEGILGSQLPESYRKIHGDKLILETKKGRKIKLMNILDGHPNARKDTSGILKWFYVPGEGEKNAMDSGVLGKKKGSNAVRSNSNSSGAVSSSVGMSSDLALVSMGIESDIVPIDMFPSVAWLREYDMNVYKWAGVEDEWTEYALRLRPDIYAYLESQGSDSGVPLIRRKSGCQVSFSTEILHGKPERFLVFVRGETGKPSNDCMLLALEITSALFKVALHKDDDDEYEDFVGETYPITEDRVHRTLEIPQAAVALITGKNNKKLHVMRKKSSAYINLVTKTKGGKGNAKLTISGSAAHVDAAVAMVKAALAETA